MKYFHMAYKNFLHAHANSFVNYRFGHLDLKSFKESILSDVRSSVDSALNVNSVSSKFCHNCGTKLEMTSTFCGECGEKQDGEEKSNSFTIEGTLEKEFAGNEYSRSKTPGLVLRSDNKTLDGTKVSLKGFDLIHRVLDNFPLLFNCF